MIFAAHLTIQITALGLDRIYSANMLQYMGNGHCRNSAIGICLNKGSTYS
jgi:hypothetical protein